MHDIALFAEERMLLCSLRGTRFVSDRKVSIVGTRWTAEKAHTVRSQVDLWRLLVLPFFVQLEICVAL